MSHVISMRRILLALSLAWLLALPVMLMVASPVLGATINVTTTAYENGTNPAACSLREAIEAANTNAAYGGCAAGQADPTVDVINLPAGTYQLEEDQLLVDGSVSIVGAGAGSTEIVGAGGVARVFFLDDGDVAMSGVTVSGGIGGESHGGGIWVNGDATLNMTASVVTENEADGDGGGLYVQGTATLTNSSVTGNDAGAVGGGIYISSSGTVNLNGSTVSQNNARDGGGIANEGSDTLNMTASIVSGNIADIDGGGIWQAWDGSANISNSTISGNIAGGNPNGGGGNGGGIYDDWCCSEGELMITASTISNNTAQGGSGGGIYSENQLVLINSTVSTNDADEDGGGIFVDGSMDMQFSTVTNNTADDDGGGMWTQGSPFVFYANIVAGNGSGGDCHHNDTSVESFGSNIDSDDSCDFDQTTDQPDTDPLLGPLVANGGPTRTHALLTGSPAIDAVEPPTVVAIQGKVQLPSCPGTDQRGVTRPQDGDDDGTAVCDIGAFEFVLAAEPTPPPTGTAAPTASELPDTSVGDGTIAVTGMAAAMLILLLISASALRTARRRG